MKARTLFSIFSFLILLLQMNMGAVLAQAEDSVPPPPEEETHYTLQTFIITAYYSPLVGQTHYVTGSYEGDIYLNGNGTNGADGTPVYPGMIAAPKTYAFGTKMYIPGVGLTAVHDRGGAIKPAGQLGNAYDRLDIWMGKGDEGLRRALGWGKRTVEVMVYGMQSELQEAVYFDQYLEVENFFTQTFLSPLEFPNDLYYGQEGDEVKEMQEYLVSWGYLAEANGFYGQDTTEALFQFQRDFSIVSSANELGAGHFGPSTRRQFDRLIKEGEGSATLLEVQKGKSLLLKYPDFYEELSSFTDSLDLGDSGEAVHQLQEELQNLGFLRLMPTGYFGETTEHALFKFQQAQGLVESKLDSGAGYLGPQTRARLNAIMKARYEAKSRMAYQREELVQGHLALLLPDRTLASLREEERLLAQ